MCVFIVFSFSREHGITFDLLWGNAGPPKHEAFIQCCFSVGAGPTLEQHWVNAPCSLFLVCHRSCSSGEKRRLCPLPCVISFVEAFGWLGKVKRIINRTVLKECWGWTSPLVDKKSGGCIHYREPVKSFDKSRAQSRLRVSFCRDIAMIAQSAT